MWISIYCATGAERLWHVTLTENYAVALVGIGKIARDQHIPSIDRNDRFTLAATVSRNASIDGVENFTAIEDMLAARPEIPVISLAIPPGPRFNIAMSALKADRHVILEKPPGATLSEVDTLVTTAQERGKLLFATWHSRFAAGVEPARQWLAARQIKRVHVTWHEDVRRWHPGQEWIWRTGGFGVFDPGINALSILTEILPMTVHLTAAELEFPSNCQTPIAARLNFADGADTPITADFDWRQTGPQSWEIDVETAEGKLKLTDGGANIAIEGESLSIPEQSEYDAIYTRFAELLARNESDVDLAPFKHVADAFMIGRRIETDAFVE
ncbi:MAG: Gfo/Idh/MocA family oxidoreductase [Hyphomicrobiales bacterium]|nr:Gfo/Idh/MocA family oxidoreductase [Hyphomicrobiales bacterium]